MLKKWHQAAGTVATVMLHNFYGHELRQYLSEVTPLTCETVELLQRAENLEKVLNQVVVEDSTKGEDNRKTVVRGMVPYEVDSIVLNLLRKWIHESMHKGKEYLQRAKETEVSFGFVVLLPSKIKFESTTKKVFRSQICDL